LDELVSEKFQMLERPLNIFLYKISDLKVIAF